MTVPKPEVFEGIAPGRISAVRRLSGHDVVIVSVVGTSGQPGSRHANDVWTLSPSVVQEIFLSTGFYQNAHLFRTEPIHEAAIHVAFSRATVPAEFMDAVRESLEEIPDFFADHMTAVTIVAPWIIDRALTSDWFFWLGLIGTAAFALSGIIIGRREAYSLFGTFVLAALPAIGGGVVRDLLVNRHPIAILETPLYLTFLIAMVVAAKVVMSVYDTLSKRSVSRTAT